MYVHTYVHTQYVRTYVHTQYVFVLLYVRTCVLV